MKSLGFVIILTKGISIPKLNNSKNIIKIEKRKKIITFFFCLLSKINKIFFNIFINLFFLQL